jgi:hypothetical protein
MNGVADMRAAGLPEEMMPSTCQAGQCKVMITLPSYAPSQLPSTMPGCSCRLSSQPITLTVPPLHQLLGSQGSAAGHGHGCLPARPLQQWTAARLQFK